MTTATRAEPTGARSAAASGCVVTGIGVAAPNGLGVEEWWAATLRGVSGIVPVTRFDASRYPVRLAGEVPGFVDEERLPSRLLPQTDRVTRLSLAAAGEAIADCGADLAELPEYGVGVVTASSAGGFEFGQRELQALWSKGGHHVSAYQSFAWFYAVNTGQISIRHGLRGSSGVVVTEQAGGLDALAHARRQIRKGARVMVAGGVDSALCPWGWAAHLAAGQLSGTADPARAYLPFDEAADGHVVGEGGALVVMEGAADARERGARPYGVFAGYATTFDGRGAPRLGAAARLALADAGLEPGDVDVVFADGAGERGADAAESCVLAELFGERGVAVTVPKSMTGRLLAGGASLDAAAALLCLRDQVIPPTAGTSRPGHPVDLVTAPRRTAVRHALVLARGRGGFNSAAVFSAVAPDRP